jgi:hypothetical protein
LFLALCILFINHDAATTSSLAEWTFTGIAANQDLNSELVLVNPTADWIHVRMEYSPESNWQRPSFYSLALEPRATVRRNLQDWVGATTGNDAATLILHASSEKLRAYIHERSSDRDWMRIAVPASLGLLATPALAETKAQGGSEQSISRISFAAKLESNAEFMIPGSYWGMGWETYLQVTNRGNQLLQIEMSCSAGSAGPQTAVLSLAPSEERIVMVS